MALKGNDRDNHFNGTIFDDEIYAFGGNDDIDGSPGSDYIDGGLGTDLIVYTYFDSVVGIFESSPTSSSESATILCRRRTNLV